MNNFKTIKLQNGATVITVPMQNTNATTVVLFFGAGSRYETPDIAGSSHLFEHLLFKGTEKRKTPKEIAEIVESKGGILNAYTDKESTGYWCKMPSEFYLDGLDVLVDMAKNPLIKTKDLDLEKNVVYEEIKAFMDSAGSRASNKADQHIWPNQPMGVDVAGSIETVKATSREDLIKYLDKQYTSSNAVLVVSGNLAHEEVINASEKAFEGFREGDPMKFSPCSYYNDKPLTVLDKMETNQSHLTIAFKNFSLVDELRHASLVLSVLLGGGMTSRLFEQVREKRGLAYSVNATSHGYSDCGVFYVDAGIAPENTEETFKVIIEEIKKVKNDLTKEEMESSKELIKGRMMMRYEDSRSIAMNYGTQYLLTNRIISIEESLEMLKEVTMKDIFEAYNYIFNNSTIIASVAGSVENIPDLTKNSQIF
tara:strand:- start:195 stop:1466 length:1272 start_codon:yes stop_codon:yes gene_type:complete